MGGRVRGVGGPARVRAGRRLRERDVSAGRLDELRNRDLVSLRRFLVRGRLEFRHGRVLFRQFGDRPAGLGFVRGRAGRHRFGVRLCLCHLCRRTGPSGDLRFHESGRDLFPAAEHAGRRHRRAEHGRHPDGLLRADGVGMADEKPGLARRRQPRALRCGHGLRQQSLSRQRADLRRNVRRRPDAGAGGFAGSRRGGQQPDLFACGLQRGADDGRRRGPDQRMARRRDLGFGGSEPGELGHERRNRGGRSRFARRRSARDLDGGRPASLRRRRHERGRGRLGDVGSPDGEQPPDRNDASEPGRRDAALGGFAGSGRDRAGPHLFAVGVQRGAGDGRRRGFDQRMARRRDLGFGGSEPGELGHERRNRGGRFRHAFQRRDRGCDLGGPAVGRGRRHERGRGRLGVLRSPNGEQPQNRDDDRGFSRRRFVLPLRVVFPGRGPRLGRADGFPDQRGGGGDIVRLRDRGRHGDGRQRLRGRQRHAGLEQRRDERQLDHLPAGRRRLRKRRDLLGPPLQSGGGGGAGLAQQRDDLRPRRRRRGRAAFRGWFRIGRVLQLLDDLRDGHHRAGGRGHQRAVRGRVPRQPERRLRLLFAQRNHLERGSGRAGRRISPVLAQALSVRIGQRHERFLPGPFLCGRRGHQRGREQLVQSPRLDRRRYRHERISPVRSRARSDPGGAGSGLHRSRPHQIPDVRLLLPAVLRAVHRRRGALHARRRFEILGVGMDGRGRGRQRHRDRGPRPRRFGRDPRGLSDGWRHRDARGRLRGHDGDADVFQRRAPAIHRGSDPPGPGR